VAETNLLGDKLAAQDELAVGVEIARDYTACAPKFCVEYVRENECPDLLWEVWRMVVCV
jgi:hypothetical protein